MRPKLSIQLRGQDKKDFIDLLNVILSHEPLKGSRILYYEIPESKFSCTGLNLTNTLLLGLSKNISSDKGTYSLLKDVQYFQGDSVELWVNNAALETAKKYLETL